jgi:hypothetical protein
MSTTNDPKAPYTPTNENAPDGPGFEFKLSTTGEQPKREPVLSNGMMQDLIMPFIGSREAMAFPGAAWDALRDFYENEITEGRLMVVGQVKTEACGAYCNGVSANGIQCAECNGTGAKIFE